MFTEERQQHSQQDPGQNYAGHTMQGLDPYDLTSFNGVIELKGKNLPQSLVLHTRARWYKVKKYYQVDNVVQWRKWRSILSNSGGKDKWLFYACPFKKIGDVLTLGSPIPYGDFFPRVFGQNALYLFDNPTSAARVAFRFGVDREGYLVSCRAAIGKVFSTKYSNPYATDAPNGYDFVLVPRGTDIGGGALESDMYATFDPDNLLIRYITHIENLLIAR